MLVNFYIQYLDNSTTFFLFLSDFAVKEGGKLAAIKQALRNKISSITTRASGWQPSRTVERDFSHSGETADE